MKISVKADKLEVVITNNGDQSTVAKPILTYKVENYEFSADAKGLLLAIQELQAQAMKMAAAAMPDDDFAFAPTPGATSAPCTSRFEPELDERR